LEREREFNSFTTAKGDLVHKTKIMHRRGEQYP